MAKTRFGLEGYGVRRAGSFAGKTFAGVVIVVAAAAFPEDADALIDAQLDSPTVRCASLVVADFKSGAAHLWGGFADLRLADGRLFEGIGNLGALSSIGAGPGGAVDEITVTVFGDERLLKDIAGDAEESAGRWLTAYLQFFDVRQRDERGVWVDWRPIGRPFVDFVGRMGPMTVKRQPRDEGGVSRIVSLPVQSRLVNRGRPAFQFWSDRDQKARSPDDNGFLRMSQYSDSVARWPAFGSGAT